MSNTATYIHIQTQVLSTSYVCTYIHMKYVRTYVHTWALIQTHNAHTGSRYTDTLHPCLTQTLWAVHEEHHHLRRVRGGSLYTTYSNTQQQNNTQQNNTQHIVSKCYAIWCVTCRSLLTTQLEEHGDWRKEPPYHQIKYHIYGIWR